MATGGSRLIGRDHDLATIGLALRSTLGDGGAVMIVGEAGAGKTALLDAALALVTADTTVVRIGFSAAEQQVAWSGLSSLLARLPEYWTANLPRVQRDAIRVATGERGPGAVAVAPSVAAAIRNLLRRATSAGSTVLAIDDLQWADDGTASAMSSALRTFGDDRLAVAVTIRPDVEPPIDLPRILGTRVVVVVPQRFDRAEVHEALRRRGIAVSQPMLDDVATLSGGNPLHTMLLAEHITEHGWRAGELPSSIARGHQSALDRVDDDVSQLLEHAAVHGRVQPDVLARCMSDVDVEAALAVAERAGLLASDEMGNPCFAHPTVPAAILARIGVVTRTVINRRLAAVLDPDDELYAVHLAASTSQPDRDIASALDRSAESALERGAKATAGYRFLSAARLTPADDTDDTWRRTLAAADAFVGGGNLDAAEAPSLVAFETAANPMQIAFAGGVRTQLLAARGDLIDTHRFVVDLLERLTGWPMLRGYLGRARVRLEQIFDLDAALRTADAMHAEMVDAGLDSLATEFRIAVANCRFVLGHPVDVAAVWNEAQPILDATDFISAGWMALELLVWSCHDDEMAFAALERFEHQASAAGASQSLAKLYDFRGNLLIRTGRWQEGKSDMQRAVDASELSEITGAMSRSGLAWLLAATGRFDEARANAALCSTASATDEVPLLLAVHRACVGFVELCAGDWHAAVAALSEAWAAADKLGMEDLASMPFRVDLVEALILCGRKAEARERARVVVELANRSGLAVAAMQADRATVLVEGADGDLDAAREAAARAESAQRLVDVPFERARLQLAFGAALRRAGRRREAAGALSDAAATFTRLGALPFLRRAEDEQRRLGIQRDDVLTATEDQIARLVASGRSNGEVAAEMVVSVRTVESNLTRIYRKLGLRSRSELAARFRDH